MSEAMIGVKRHQWPVIDVESVYVLASDYDRDVRRLVELHENAHAAASAAMTERDELRAQVEAMRALLTDARRYVDKAWPDGVHSYRANSVSGDLLGKIDAALQANP